MTPTANQPVQESERPINPKSFLGEMIGTGLLLLGILLFLALISFEERQMIGEQLQPISNIVGTFGHYTARGLLFAFGQASFLIGPYLLVLGILNIYRGRLPDLAFRFIALLFLLIALAVLIFLFVGFDPQKFASGGGVIGRRLGQGMRYLFGFYGAVILNAGFLIAGLFMGTRLPLAEFLLRLREMLDRPTPPVNRPKRRTVSAADGAMPPLTEEFDSPGVAAQSGNRRLFGGKIQVRDEERPPPFFEKRETLPAGEYVARDRILTDGEMPNGVKAGRMSGGLKRPATVFEEAAIDRHDDGSSVAAADRSGGFDPPSDENDLQGYFNGDESRFYFLSDDEGGEEAGKRREDSPASFSPRGSSEPPLGDGSRLLKPLNVTILERDSASAEEEPFLETVRDEEIARQSESFRQTDTLQRTDLLRNTDVRHNIDVLHNPDVNPGNGVFPDPEGEFEDDPDDPTRMTAADDEDFDEDPEWEAGPVSSPEDEIESDEMERTNNSFRAGRGISIPKSGVPVLSLKGRTYRLPLQLLEQSNNPDREETRREIEVSRSRLERVLKDYGIAARVVRHQRGPMVTLYEIKPDPGVKVSRILGIQDEIKMNLEAASVRILAPLPGKATIGLELPNQRRDMVTMGDILRGDRDFYSDRRELSIVLGKDIGGRNHYVDLTDLPHLLLAGATGSGKSVYMNTIIASLLYTRSPEEVRFIMIDPKLVEFSLFEGIPHLLMPVITDVRKASQALAWAVAEMEKRYALLSDMRCRDIRSYNERVAADSPEGKMPYLVILIDELSDLMMMAAKDVEDSIIRLTQKARAVGIHVIMATQRPSVDVITALIKANCPARIAFQVAQRTDSRTILDANGAEALVGRGDMLYKSPDAVGLTRIQAPLITETEIERLVQEALKFGRPIYVEPETDGGREDDGEAETEEDQELFQQAWEVVLESGKTSTSYIQRRLRIGYNRAARLVEKMEEMGYLSPVQGNRPREILKKA